MDTELLLHGNFSVKLETDKHVVKAMVADIVEQSLKDAHLTQTGSTTCSYTNPGGLQPSDKFQAIEDRFQQQDETIKAQGKKIESLTGEVNLLKEDKEDLTKTVTDLRSQVSDLERSKRDADYRLEGTLRPLFLVLPHIIISHACNISSLLSYVTNGFN